MELEAVLLLHPKVADCAVFGIQRSSEDSELPAAYIVLRPGCKLTEIEVHEFTLSRLTGYKQLRGGIRFIDQLPGNANGKVMKNELKHMLMQDIKARL
jgi:acyl-coenzyme A synthetase/AMP-(fatty) acid ligase